MALLADAGKEAGADAAGTLKLMVEELLNRLNGAEIPFSVTISGKLGPVKLSSTKPA